MAIVDKNQRLSVIKDKEKENEISQRGRRKMNHYNDLNEKSRRIWKKVVTVVICAIALQLVTKGMATWAVEKDLGGKGSPFKTQNGKVIQLFRDISTINLINGMNLTKEQMEKVLTLAREAQRIRERYTADSGEIMAALKETEEAYRALRAEIQKGTPARGNIPRRASRAKQSLKEQRDRGSRGITAELASLEDELEQVLTPEQLQVVNSFKPCLIPPKDLNNPVRAGQASSNVRAVKRLRHLRDISDSRWRERKEKMAERMVESFSRRRYRLTEEEKEAEKSRFLQLAEKVRGMSDVDFELEKEKLAQQLKPKDKIHELREQMNQRRPYRSRPKVSRLVRYLLGDRVIPILEERLLAYSGKNE